MPRLRMYCIGGTDPALVESYDKSRRISQDGSSTVKEAVPRTNATNARARILCQAGSRDQYLSVKPHQQRWKPEVIGVEEMISQNRSLVVLSSLDPV